MTCISKLLDIASSPELGTPPLLDADCQRLAGPLGPRLLEILHALNGFYAFESALHFLPADVVSGPLEINQWNSFDLWRFEYRGLADECLFFAEDAFGGQFCIFDGAIYNFDAETGDKNWLAHDFESFADILLGDFQFLTGYPLAHEWQVKFGPIPPGQRLVPILPFVAGGEFSLSNLRLMDRVKAMRMRGDVATQIRDLPDGTPIEIKVRE